MTSHRPHLGARFSIFLSVYIGGPWRLARSAPPRCAREHTFYSLSFLFVPSRVPLSSSRHRGNSFHRLIRKNVLLKRVCRPAKFPRLGGSRCEAHASFFSYSSVIQAGNLALFHWQWATISPNREIIVRICSRAGERDRKEILAFSVRLLPLRAVFYQFITLRWNNGFSETKERLLLLGTGTVSRVNKVSRSFAELEMKVRV